MAYEDIPHVEFKGARIYMPERKSAMIMEREYWTASQLQKQLKCGYYATMHLIEYMKSIGVITGAVLSHGEDRYYVIKETK